MAPKAQKRKAADGALFGTNPDDKRRTKKKTTEVADADGVSDASSGVVPSGAAAELVAGLTDTHWREALTDEFLKPYFAEIAAFVAEERQKHLVHPPADKVFEALNVTPLNSVRVVILGQDPYHEPGQAHGLCFSVQPGIKTPPSLVNMYKELVTDMPGFVAPDHGYLMDWAKQGVLLLNATLTVRGGHKEANSHSKCGWQKFTDEVIGILNRRPEKVVFLLWGGFAQKKGKIIDKKRHVVLEAAHPSPLSVTKWRGCKAFSKCNEALRRLGHAEIDWSLGPVPKVPGGDSQKDLKQMFGSKPS